MAKRNSECCRRYVDMWILGSLHPSNINLLQRLKSADDRQFGTNMDVCGTVSDFDSTGEDWNKTHLVGIRSDIWSPDEHELNKSLNSLQRERRELLRRDVKRSGRLNEKQKQQLDAAVADDSVMDLSVEQIEKRRLVLKLFQTTGERLQWCGTLEELTTREIHNTIGSRRALLSLAAVLPGYEFLTEVQQNHRTFRIPSIFTFCFHDVKQHRAWYVNIQRRWISWGADFDIVTEGRKIGVIDGDLIGLGYNAYITIHEPALAENGDFMDLLTLFAASVGYHRAMRRQVRRRVAAAKIGPVHGHVIEDEELWLLKNPRRRAA
jgi:hypothetical protein